MKQHNRQIHTKQFHISQEDAVFQELGDMILAADSMAGNFRESHRRSPIQQRIHDAIKFADIDDDDYDPEDEEDTEGQGRTMHVLLYGSMGSGKSTFARSEIMEILLDYPGAEALGARRTYAEIESTIYTDVCVKTCDRYGIPYVPNKKYTTIYLKNSSIWRMRSAEKTAQGKDDKTHELGSTEYSVALLEEADEIPEEFAKTVAGRMRQNVGVKRKVIFYVCNPPDKNHWIYEWFFVKHDPDDPKSRYRAFFMPVEENLMHVGKNYLKDIHEDYADNPQLYLRQVKGQFGPRVKGIPIFSKCFSREIHVAKTSIRENWDRNQKLQRSWDFGFHRPACIVFQDDDITGQIRIYWMLLGHRQLVDTFAKEVKRKTADLFPGADWDDTCDPAGEAKSDKSELSSCDTLRGLKIFPKSTKSSIDFGLSIIEQELKKLIPSRNGPLPGIVLDPDVEIMIDAFEFGYCQEKIEQSPKGETKPVKDGYYEHGMDAFRYGLIFRRKAGEGNKYHDRKDQWVAYKPEGPESFGRFSARERELRSTPKSDSMGPRYNFGKGR